VPKTRHIAWDERSATAVNARRHLPGAVSAYFAEVRGALAENPPPPELHRLRLATKRVRYTLELFRPCYGPGLETRLEELRRLQSVLGDVNDSGVALRLISDSVPSSPQMERVRRYLEGRAAAKALEFRKDWAEFDAPGREELWISYLARNAHSKGRRG
jgi:CHAD domain-containing protein